MVKWSRRADKAFLLPPLSPKVCHRHHELDMDLCGEVEVQLQRGRPPPSLFPLVGRGHRQRDRDFRGVEKKARQGLSLPPFPRQEGDPPGEERQTGLGCQQRGCSLCARGEEWQAGLGC